MKSSSLDWSHEQTKNSRQSRFVGSAEHLSCGISGKLIQCKITSLSYFKSLWIQHGTSHESQQNFPLCVGGEAIHRARWATHSVSKQVPLATLLPEKRILFCTALNQTPIFCSGFIDAKLVNLYPPPRNRPPIHQRVVQRTPEETSSISTLKRMEFNGVFCARMGWILRKNAIWQVWWWWWGGWWGWLETKPFYERGPTPLPMIEMSQNLWPIQAVLNMIGKVYSGCLNRGIRETIGVNHKTVLENIFCGIHLPSPENPWKPTMGSHKHPRTSPCKRHTKNDMWNTPNSQMDKTDKTTFNLLSSLRQMFFPPDKYGFLKPSYGGGSFHPISISVYTLVISSRKNHIIASKIETYRNQIIVESDKQIAPFVELMA